LDGVGGVEKENSLALAVLAPVVWDPDKLRRVVPGSAVGPERDRLAHKRLQGRLGVTKDTDQAWRLLPPLETTQQSGRVAANERTIAAHESATVVPYGFQASMLGAHFVSVLSSRAYRAISHSMTK